MPLAVLDETLVTVGAVGGQGQVIASVAGIAGGQLGAIAHRVEGAALAEATEGSSGIGGVIDDDLVDIAIASRITMVDRQGRAGKRRRCH